MRNVLAFVILLVLLILPALAACSSGPTSGEMRSQAAGMRAQADSLATAAVQRSVVETQQAYRPPTSTPIPTPTLVPTATPEPSSTPLPPATPIPTSEPRVITQIVVLTATPAAPLFTRDEQRRFVLTGVLIVVLLVVGAGMIGLVLFATRKMFGGRVFFLPSEPSEPSEPSQPNRRRSKKP